MSDLMTCSVCGWRGPCTPGAWCQFDHKNRCPHCQPEKKTKKKKYNEYVERNVNFDEEDGET